MGRRHIVSSALLIYVIKICRRFPWGWWVMTSDLWNSVILRTTDLKWFWKVLCGTFATKIIYIQCCTEDGDSPAVTWAWTLYSLVASVNLVNIRWIRCYLDWQRMPNCHLKNWRKCCKSATREASFFSYLSFFTFSFGELVFNSYWCWCCILFDRLTAIAVY